VQSQQALSGAREMRFFLAISIAFALTGCATQPPQSIPVPVLSSKPYKFLTWSVDDTPETKAGIRAHNRAHQAVLNAEKRAAEQK
jgi:hypothetical protein